LLDEATLRVAQDPLVAALLSIPPRSVSDGREGPVPKLVLRLELIEQSECRELNEREVHPVVEDDDRDVVRARCAGRVGARIVVADAVDNRAARRDDRIERNEELVGSRP
jgi:hypothetical protein